MEDVEVNESVLERPSVDEIKYVMSNPSFRRKVMMAADAALQVDLEGYLF